jgi:D-aminoacyl-tRNA deacylase
LKLSPEIVVVNSVKDPAGSNIHESLLRQVAFAEQQSLYEDNPVYFGANGICLVSTKKEIVFAEGLDREFSNTSKAFSYVFVSRHRAESGIPSLTAHFTGNFGSNDFGGLPGELAFCDPSMQKKYLLHLQANRNAIPARFNITLEATHHGPTSLLHPVLFVELGSGPSEWSEKGVADIIAKTLLQSFQDQRKYSKCAIGLGGTHYSEKFNKLVLETEIALGHIIPKYALDRLSREMLRQAIDKSVIPVNIAALDWKGLGRQKQAVIEMAQEMGLEILKL